MATWLKLATAVEIPVGPFLDETDGKTPETALSITQPDIRLKKNGGAWAQKNAAQTLTHEENGWYEVSLDTTDTGTLGHLVVAIHESGALPVWREFMVVPAAVYDAMLAGSGNGVRADVQVVASAAADAVAAALLKLDLTTVSGEARRSVFNALRVLLNKVSVAAGTMTVTKEDDVTSAWTAAVATTAGDPVSSVDPV